MSVLPRRGLAIRGVVVMATLALAGCAADEEPAERPADPPAQELPAVPSVSADPAEAEAIEEILTALQGFRDVEADLYADPPPPNIVRREISPYLADPMHGETVGTLYDLYNAGIAFVGRPVSEPTVVEVRLDDIPPTATVRDCVDATSWRSIFLESGNPVPGEGLPDHYMMQLEAKLYPDYGWLFEDFDMEEGTQC